MMKRLSVYLTVLVLAAACQQQEEGVEAKKSQLQAYQKEVKELQRKISALEEQIAAEDPDFAAVDKNATLVTVIPVQTDTFRHFIEVRGNVASDRNVTINAEAPAEVTRIHVEKGDKVKKGQLLLLQDAATIQRNMEELETSLELARTRYERQSNLWEQKIGTEMQYLEAKNNLQSLEKRLASARTQMSNYVIRAPFSGTVDEVFVKEGEVAMAGTPMLRLVSLQDMYITADVSEAYLGEFDRGDAVTVRFPSLNKSLASSISSVGQVINENNRTFEIQVKLPKDASLLRPNLLAVLEIKDYEQHDVVVVPTNLIQRDNRGDYVFVAKETEEGMVAEKKRVERGMTYNNHTEVKAGIGNGEQLIADGAREVAEGVKVRIAGRDGAGNAMSAKE